MTGFKVDELVEKIDYRMIISVRRVTTDKQVEKNIAKQLIFLNPVIAMLFSV